MKDKKGRRLRENESQLESGVYRYRYTVDGKRHSIYSWRLTASDKTPAGKKDKPPLRELEESLQKDLLNGIKIAEKKATVAEQIEKYLGTKCQISPMTIQRYRGAVRSTIETSPLYCKAISEVKPSDVVKLYSEMLKKGLSLSSVQIVQCVLSPAFQLAVDDNVITVNPCRDALSLITSKSTKRVREPLTRQQQNRLAQYLKEQESKETYMIFAIFLGTGVRLGELCGLTWNDVDLEKSCIYVRRQLCRVVENGKGFYFCKEPKYNEVRRIPIQENLRKLLYEFRENSFDESSSSDVSVDGVSGFLFVSGDNVLLTTKRVGHVFGCVKKRYAKWEVVKASQEGRPPVLLPELSPHVLRHTYCTRMAEAGMDIKVLQAVMGHKDVTITMDVYNHASKERILSQLPKINRMEL